MLSQHLLGKHLQIDWEIFQEFHLVSYSLKERKTFVLSLKTYWDQEVVCLLNYEFPEQQGKESIGCSEVVKKIFTKLVQISSGLLEDWT